MRIAIASDHSGYALKGEVAQYLASLGHEVEDFGTDSEAACDLSDFIYPASLAVASGECERGIFIDGVGYGSALTANRILGITAAICQDPFCAKLAREHSDSNVLCIGGKIIGSAIAIEIIRVWLTTDFAGDVEKYRRRVDKVNAICERHLRPLSEISSPV